MLYSSLIMNIQGQITTTPSRNITSAASAPDNSMVSISSSVTVPISNQTIKTNEGTLRSAVISFLNSGPNILKTSESSPLGTKTKIINQINNTTQSVEGIEATNAIIGVELSKAIRSIIAQASQRTHSEIINVSTSSVCKPSLSTISCDNSIVIK